MDAPELRRQADTPILQDAAHIHRHVADERRLRADGTSAASAISQHRLDPSVLLLLLRRLLRRRRRVAGPRGRPFPTSGAHGAG